MVVEIKNPKQWVVTKYASLNGLMKHLEKTKDMSTNQTSGKTYGNEGFYGTRNFDEALAILKNGSEEIKKGLKEHVKIAIDKLNKELNTQPQGYVADVEGLFFDVAKVIEGEPEAWYREPWDKVKKPRLKIPLVGSYNANFKVETAIQNASEIIALVKALEDNGFECEIAMIFPADRACGKTGKGAYQEVMVKNYDESFNWNKLSAMLHPSFFRRIIFRDLEVALPTTLASGYGRTTKDTMKAFKGGENFLNIGDHSSIERFKNEVLYKLSKKGK